MAKLLSELPLGAKIKELGTGYKGQVITWLISRNNTADNAITLIAEKVLSVRAYDAIEPNFTGTMSPMGNPDYGLSNIRLWLNSRGDSWYVGQHGSDMQPSHNNLAPPTVPYVSEPGFLKDFSEAFLNALVPTTITPTNMTTSVNKVFLPAIQDFDSLFPTLDSRKAYPTEYAATLISGVTTAKPWRWWAREITYLEAGGSYFPHPYMIRVDGNGEPQQPASSEGVRPALRLASNILVSDNPDNDGAYILMFNAAPTINVTSPTANQTLHENSTLTLAGNTTDLDADDVVTIKYQIDSGSVRNLSSSVSDGTTPINFTKTLTYKDGVIKDGNSALTSVLDKDVPHTVSMWAEDGKGGKSNIITRTFFVVPNRPPSITVNPIPAQSELINSNVINISGAVTDLDNNDVTVKFKINDGEEQQVYQGPPSAFTFNILLNDLKVGANTVIVKATDSYNTSGTKTLTINKTHNATAVNTAVARYQIQAPTGSAKSILLWVTRTLGNLGITAEVSLTNGNDAENYVALNETNSAIVNGLREEEYAYQGTVDKEKIILKITYDRTDAAVIDTIKQVSGVLF